MQVFCLFLLLSGNPFTSKCVWEHLPRQTRLHLTQAYMYCGMKEQAHQAVNIIGLKVLRFLFAGSSLVVVFVAVLTTKHLVGKLLCSPIVALKCWSWYTVRWNTFVLHCVVALFCKSSSWQCCYTKPHTNRLHICFGFSFIELVCIVSCISQQKWLFCCPKLTCIAIGKLAALGIIGGTRFPVKSKLRECGLFTLVVAAGESRYIYGI